MKVKVKSLSRVRLFVTPWTVAYQASPSMEFSRHEYWSGVESNMLNIIRNFMLNFIKAIFTSEDKLSLMHVPTDS